MACRPTYQLFRFEPIAPGQKSTDSEDGKPLYRFAFITQRMCACPLAKFDYSLYNADNTVGKPLAVAGLKCACKTTLDVKNMNGECVANIQQRAFCQFECA